MAEDPVSKTIRLTELSDTKSYRLWAAQTEATFGVHGVMDIVLGERLRPKVPETLVAESMAEDDARRAQEVAARQAQEDHVARQAQETKKWDRQNALARQALLACLPTSELTNVYQLKLASEIWSRLAQEHGAISTARRAIANRNFYQLLKAPSTSVDAHIPVFTSYLQDLNYNSDIPLKDVDVNVAFLASLGPSWQTFQQSMGERVNTLKPAMLYAEVRVFESQKDKAEQPEKANEDNVAFALHKVQKGKVEKRRDGGRDVSHWDGYDAKKFCVFCKFKGHNVKECYKSLWKKQIAEDEERGRSRKTNEWSFNGQGQREGSKFIGWNG
jgi:hypothetical protein